jgi:hypothetical protein
MTVKSRKHYFKFLPLTILFFSVTTNAGSLKPFTSDGCSSFPDGTFAEKNLWLNCCKVHDKSYWQGGTQKQRLDADNHLKECVAKTGRPKIAKLMLAGVRVGGSPYWPTSFRWGYGWDYPKDYAELTQQEKKLVQKQWDVFVNKPFTTNNQTSKN